MHTSSESVASLRARLERAEREAAAHQRQLERYAADLRESYRRERARAQQLRRSYKATVRALSNAVEARDAYTGKHAERVAAYGLAIARVAGIDVADEPQLEFGFLLHDIGKVGVPDAILFKPAALSKDEFVRIASHAEIGSEILRHVDFLAEATLIVRHHHERWDGTGYPDGLRGEQIPLAARVFAIADTLDALTTDRPYRRAVGWEAARKVIHEGAGTQFDPAMIAAYGTLGDDTFARLSEGVHSPSSTER
ncbi:MAG TPA: HD domain-containing phosphohydrolase [Solirubrobacteraceae bacterium]|nr:HD domain-containing phosphohydrolase [Solirubrobacteraceae bacterium]